MKAQHEQKPLVIKVGSRVLTTDEGMLDIEVVKNMVEQISHLYKQGRKIVLVSSGAAQCGREVLCLHKEDDPIVKKQMYTAIGQARLMRVYRELFEVKGIPVGQALLERTNFSIRKRYLNLKRTIEGLINHGVIPIINENDVVATRGLRFGDNDELASLLAVALDAERLLICSDVDGFYTNDPTIDPTAERIAVVESITGEMQKMAKDTSSHCGLGGMMSKLKVAKMATHWGIETWIVKGKQENCVLDVLQNKDIGTRFLAEPNPAKDFHKWLASSALTCGAVIRIDEGAAKAIQDRKSLLLVGVQSIEGEFEKGEIVDVYCGDDWRVAVGVTNYNHLEVQEYLRTHKEDRRFQIPLISTDNIVLVP